MFTDMSQSNDPTEELARDLELGALAESDAEAAAWDEILDDLDGAIEATAEKVEHGRVRDSDKERVRIKRVRLLKQLLDSKRKTLRDRQETRFDELADELREFLEEENRGR